MRISDWSSDVCSSDLFDVGSLFRSEGLVRPQARPVRQRIDAARLVPAPGRRIEEEFVGGLPVDADRQGRGLRLALDLAACGEIARAIAWPAHGAGSELVRAEENKSEPQYRMRTSYEELCVKKTH